MRSKTIAIHDGHSSWSDRWLMWHFDPWRGEALIAATHVLSSAAAMGLKVFPNFATCWHFDDELAQKYLLEALDARLIPTHAFFSHRDALDWLAQTEFPVVAKLRRGAGSYNVRLLRNVRQAKAYCRVMFRRGIQPVPGVLADARTKARRVSSLAELGAALAKAPRFFRLVAYGHRTVPREKGYVLFQRFAPGNTYDTRVAVVGDRHGPSRETSAKGDFRASGSGSICYDLDRIHVSCVRAAFRVANSLGPQSIAFDFVRDSDGKYYIVEMIYGYVGSAIFRCAGYWDPNLRWHDGHLWPEDEIIANFLADVCGGVP